MYIGNTANIVICWRKNASCGTHYVMNEPTPSVRILYCKRQTHKAWERGYQITIYFSFCRAWFCCSFAQVTRPVWLSLDASSLACQLSCSFEWRFFCIFAICNACILITMFNVHPPSSPFSLVLFSHSLYHHSLYPLSLTSSPPTSSHTVHFSLPHLPHCFLSSPLSCAFNNLSIIQ